jgi:hypothetical protein
MDGARGDTLETTNSVLLSSYTAGGTTAPVVGDLVMVSSTGNWRVVRAADDTTKRLGQVVKVELAPVGTALGYVVVRWLDAIRVVELLTDDLSTVTLGNSLIKDGDTTVGNNVDAGATTGPIVCVSKSAAAGAGKVWGLVFGS